MAPGLVRRLTAAMDLSIRLRSANRDECFTLLLTEQADLTLTYRSADEEVTTGDAFLEECDLGRESLVPVFATDALPALNQAYARGELPVIAYPADVFLGRLMNHELIPGMPEAAFIRRKAETALTLAALQLALAGVGVAWVPQSLAAKELANGGLTELSDTLPSSELSIAAARLAGPKSPAEQAVLETVEASGRHRPTVAA